MHNKGVQTGVKTRIIKAKNLKSQVKITLGKRNLECKYMTGLMLRSTGISSLSNAQVLEAVWREKLAIDRTCEILKYV